MLARICWYIVIIWLFSSCNHTKTLNIVEGIYACEDSIVYRYTDNCAMDIKVDYFNNLRSSIETNWKYPYDAAAAGIGGSIQVFFIIDNNGQLLCANIQNSSGSKLLDGAAIEAIVKAGPFSKLPTCFNTNEIYVNAKFHYVHGKKEDN